MPATLKTYSFRLILAGVAEFTDAMADALFEAGCDDAGLGSCNGIVSVDFDREADSLGDAIGSAIKDVERAGLAVARVEVEAEKTSVTRESTG
jgi:hypothetical protein